MYVIKYDCTYKFDYSRVLVIENEPPPPPPPVIRPPSSEENSINYTSPVLTPETVIISSCVTCLAMSINHLL